MSAIKEIPSDEAFVAQRHRVGNTENQIADLMEHHEGLSIATFAFHSAAGLSGVGSINLGGHKSIKSNPTDVGKALVSHNPGGMVDKDNFGGSLNRTKFGKGFQRRLEGDISNVLKDQEQATMLESEARKEKMRETRLQEIKDRETGRGFNILTGQILEGSGYKDPQPKINYSDGLGPEAPARGFSMLRESPVGRFHQPLPSGDNHDMRQGMLHREGLNNQKFTGILASGKADLPSYGVEDQFSKSEYDKQHQVPGLNETRVPGKYTPRKQPGNPSGDPELRDHWAKGFSLG